MFSFAAIWEGFKLFSGGLLSKISLKGVLIFLALCLLGYSQYRLYEYGKSQQLVTDQVKFDKDAKTIANQKTTIADLRTSVGHWQDTATLAQADFKKLHDVTLKNIQTDLDNANKRAADWKKKAQTPREVIKYVTAKADTQCVIPVGFVELFNGSIEETQSATYDSGVLSGGFRWDADSPSGLKLSQVSGVLSYDLAEAVQRGRKLNEWIDWYTATKANWDIVQAVIRKTLPNVNQPDPPLASPPKE